MRSSVRSMSSIQFIVLSFGFFVFIKNINYSAKAASNVDEDDDEKSQNDVLRIHTVCTFSFDVLECSQIITIDR